ncbi:hypothetical protein TSUD_61000 [Trifolium subterraneum]|uniref:Uncharacterized protein n=1 Tax=Trifolium subterraneum TaxID=3900 RepID=A0A2Z6NCF8_TRISU|nr:hypothetical protein TSUD_61000 [Trifolium subterraneum]
MFDRRSGRGNFLGNVVIWSGRRTGNDDIVRIEAVESVLEFLVQCLAKMVMERVMEVVCKVFLLGEVSLQ